MNSSNFSEKDIAVRIEALIPQLKAYIAARPDDQQDALAQETQSALCDLFNAEASRVYLELNPEWEDIQNEANTWSDGVEPSGWLKGKKTWQEVIDHVMDHAAEVAAQAYEENQNEE